MTHSKQIDIIKSLETLSDDEAMAIMEDRIPSSDLPEVDEAALSIARGLLGDGGVDDAVHEAENSDNVEEFLPPHKPPVTQQPWMKMAAAMVLGIMISTLINIGPTNESGGLSSASSNVVFLETVRSGDLSDLMVVEVTGEDAWITLIADPSPTDAERLRVFIDREAGDSADPAGSPGRNWTVILEQTTGIGTRDSVVVNVDSKLLTAGVHRLRIDSESGGQKISSSEVLFLVTQP